MKVRSVGPESGPSTSLVVILRRSPRLSAPHGERAGCVRCTPLSCRLAMALRGIGSWRELVHELDAAPVEANLGQRAAYLGSGLLAILGRAVPLDRDGGSAEPGTINGGSGPRKELDHFICPATAWQYCGQSLVTHWLSLPRSGR